MSYTLLKSKQLYSATTLACTNINTTTTMLKAYCHKAAHIPTTTGRNEVRREKKSSNGMELTTVTEKQILCAARMEAETG